jgi:hypothetical protein
MLRKRKLREPGSFAQSTRSCASPTLTLRSVNRRRRISVATRPAPRPSISSKPFRDIDARSVGSSITCMIAARIFSTERSRCQPQISGRAELVKGRRAGSLVLGKDDQERRQAHESRFSLRSSGVRALWAAVAQPGILLRPSLARNERVQELASHARSRSAHWRPLESANIRLW